MRRKEGGVFLESLPQSGRDGTLHKRLHQAPYAGRILGKTGYIAGVSALSGYVLDEENRPVLAFSVLINDVPSGKGWLADRLEDSICRMLVDSLTGR